jgi:hypothetical protein
VTPTVEPPEVERAANGLRVRGHALYLEHRDARPWGSSATRAALPRSGSAWWQRSDHQAAIEAALPRALRRSAALPAAYGQAFALGCSA